MVKYICNIPYLLLCLSWYLSTNIGVYGIEVATTVPPKLLNILKNTNSSRVLNSLNKTRRILNGEEVNDRRPYMVYLRLPKGRQSHEYRNWLCGGVIVHPEYILTSAACIEDAKHFYIVAGTWSYAPDQDQFNNPCIKNGAKKAVWKCVPRNYVFDGHENDNLRWMNNDLAVVKTEDEFDFTRRIRGCDFTPKPICYNNVSKSFEDPDKEVTIAGWGSTYSYNDWVNSRRQSAGEQVLLETYVTILEKHKCKSRWGKQYHSIIDNYMICTRDNIPYMSEICNEKYTDCHDMMSSDEDSRRSVINPSQLRLHSGYHNMSIVNDTRKSHNRDGGSGGFCENDHGGPLVYGEGVNSMVIGVISACLVKERTNKCYGPFLYTSVFKNRGLIDCAIYKQINHCQKMFRASVTHVEETLSWVDHPDGPAKNELVTLSNPNITASEGLFKFPSATETVMPNGTPEADKL